MVKTPNCREAFQLAVHKRGSEVDVNFELRKLLNLDFGHFSVLSYAKSNGQVEKDDLSVIYVFLLFTKKMITLLSRGKVLSLIVYLENLAPSPSKIFRVAN